MCKTFDFYTSSVFKSQFLSSGGLELYDICDQATIFHLAIWETPADSWKLLDGQRKFPDIFPLTEMQELRVDAGPLFHLDELSWHKYLSTVCMSPLK